MKREPELTYEQQEAVAQIKDADEPGERFLLTGDAGAGKTVAAVNFIKSIVATGRTVAYLAPTHKAVAVGRKKIIEAKIAIECRTLASALGVKPQGNADKIEFVRDRFAEPFDASVAVIDEGGMIGKSMAHYVRTAMPRAFVLVMGDEAQIGPVGEGRSELFDTRRKAHLATVMRYSGPILDAANVVRRSQAVAGIDSSWIKTAHRNGSGVFVPKDARAWVRKAFTSKEFAENEDTFRFIAWTNARVNEVNRQIRAWRFGEIEEPFVPGEMALVKKPIIHDYRMDANLLEDEVQFSNGEEALVKSIEKTLLIFPIEKGRYADAWDAAVRVWGVRMVRKDGVTVQVHLPRDPEAHERNLNRLREECAEDRPRWSEFHAYNNVTAQLAGTAALTCHNSQGSTFRNIFVDVRDIMGAASRGKSRAESELEAKKLLYTGITRAEHLVMPLAG